MKSLDYAQKMNPLWAHFEAELRSELQVLRERNDGMLGSDETNVLRGRIQQIKAFLAIGKDAPQID